MPPNNCPTFIDHTIFDKAHKEVLDEVTPKLYSVFFTSKLAERLTNELVDSTNPQEKFEIKIRIMTILDGIKEERGMEFVLKNRMAVWLALGNRLTESHMTDIKEGTA